MSEVSFEEILRRLSKAKVRFVLIGGLALGARGVVRGTKDVDVVIDRASDNATRLAEVAVELGGQVQTGDGFYSTPFSIAAALSSGERVALETRHGLLDVVGGLPHVPAYDELILRAEPASIGGVTVQVCSVEDLREMKAKAGRPQDLVDLASLDAILEGS